MVEVRRKSLSKVCRQFPWESGVKKLKIGLFAEVVTKSRVLFFESYCIKINETRMWANAQPDGRPAEHRWRPLFNAAKFG